jgi:hypothetical protein
MMEDPGIKEVDFLKAVFEAAFFETNSIHRHNLSDLFPTFDEN